MAVTQAQIGYGFILSHATTVGGTYTPVVAIEEIKPTKITIDKVAINTNTSPDLFGEKIPGWKDGGDYTIKAIYDGASYAALYALAGVPLYWKFIRPIAAAQTTGATTAFYGFISEFGDEVPVKSAQTYEFKITLSGGQTFAVGT